MYTVTWSREDGGSVGGSAVVQYVPDIADVIRFAFGSEGAKFVVIEKED